MTRLRHRGPDDPAVAEAARDLQAAHLREYARKLVASWPELTPGQRDDVRAIIAPVVNRRAAARRAAGGALHASSVGVTLPSRGSWNGGGSDRCDAG